MHIPPNSYFIKDVFYLRTARELAGFLPAAREAYRDLLWLYEIARVTWIPVVVNPPEVEMVACFRTCTPMEHDEPVWFTECEYDCEEWVHCGILQAIAAGDDALRPTASFDTSPSLAEVCSLPSPHAATSSLLPESNSCLSQGEVPERVPKNTSGGSAALGLGPPLSFS